MGAHASKKFDAEFFRQYKEFLHEYIPDEEQLENTVQDIKSKLMTNQFMNEYLLLRELSPALPPYEEIVVPEDAEPLRIGNANAAETRAFMSTFCPFLKRNNANDANDEH